MRLGWVMRGEIWAMMRIESTGRKAMFGLGYFLEQAVDEIGFEEALILFGSSEVF